MNKDFFLAPIFEVVDMINSKDYKKLIFCGYVNREQVVFSFGGDLKAIMDKRYFDENCDANSFKIIEYGTIISFDNGKTKKLVLTNAIKKYAKKYEL